MKNILILGGTGFVGSALCDKLVGRFGAGSARIVVASRRPAQAKHLITLPTVEVVAADVHLDADLARLVQGCDAVVNLVAILHGSPAAFGKVHVDLPARLARCCEAAGVRRVIHVSALGVAADAPSNYLRSKAAGEEVWRKSGLDWTILRPSVIFGAGDRFLNLFADLLAVFPVFPLAGASARFQPVWVEDVAEAITRCLAQPNTIGQTLECAGPDILTLGELVQLAGRCSGHARLVIPVPMAIGQAQAAVMACLPGEPPMSRDNLRSLGVPNVASGSLPGLASLGIRPAALQAIAPGYLDPARHPRARFNLLRTLARRG